MSGRRRLLQRLGLLCVGLLVALASAEIFARWVTRDGVGLGRVPIPPDLFHVEDGLRTTVPGHRGYVVMPGQQVEPSFDERGLRGAPLASPEPGWLALGDSFTLALHVPRELSFAARLEDRLGRTVYNAGVDGYSTYEATERYRRLAPDLALEGVVLTICLGNDLYDNQVWEERDRMGHDLWADVTPPRPAPPWSRFVFRHSHLRALIASRLEVRQRDGREARDGRLVLPQDIIFSREGFDHLRLLLPSTRGALAELQAEARARGHRLVVGFAPEAIQVYPELLRDTLAYDGLDPAQADPDAPNRALTTLLRELGIEACDPTDTLRRAAEVGERPYLRWDAHWSAIGHEIYAQALMDCMAEGSP